MALRFEGCASETSKLGRFLINFSNTLSDGEGMGLQITLGRLPWVFALLPLLGPDLFFMSTTGDLGLLTEAT